MKDQPGPHVVAHGRVPAPQKFLRERCGALPTMGSGVGQKMAQREVAGMRGHKIQEAGLGHGVTEGSDGFYLLFGQFHSDKISAVNSRSSKTLRNFEASSLRA